MIVASEHVKARTLLFGRRVNMSYRVVLAFVMAAVLLGGCSENRTIVVDTDPPGAKVFMNGIAQGESPCSAKFDAFWDDPQELKVTMDGYTSEIRRIEKKYEASYFGQPSRGTWPEQVFIRLARVEPSRSSPRTSSSTTPPASGGGDALDNANSAAFCSSCGRRNQAGETFCPQCGTKR